METAHTLSLVLLVITGCAALGYWLARYDDDPQVPQSWALWIGIISGSLLYFLLALVGIHTLANL